ncbi:MAG: hypothetical protein Q8R09_03500, partial [Anaerolineaceae bacterium]|nr:hypothetical protein [Anaerolineaceae bacterium]
LGTNLDFFSNLSLTAFSGYAPWVLGTLFAGMLAALYFMNRKVLSAQVPPLIPPLPPEIIR